jgi:hypothetical protein
VLRLTRVRARTRRSPVPAMSVLGHGVDTCKQSVRSRPGPRPPWLDPVARRAELARFSACRVHWTEPAGAPVRCRTGSFTRGVSPDPADRRDDILIRTARHAATLGRPSPHPKRHGSAALILSVVWRFGTREQQDGHMLLKEVGLSCPRSSVRRLTNRWLGSAIHRVCPFYPTETLMSTDTASSTTSIGRRGQYSSRLSRRVVPG